MLIFKYTYREGGERERERDERETERDREIERNHSILNLAKAKNEVSNSNTRYYLL